ncbi:hypothetical protein NH286_07525 [Anaerococcus sp. NML200574]|uniref:ABC transporter permease n=1 Tax=Anaerococcus kampingae TaxID=3115614 RepID=A0ABW9MGY0_9FIRM|nr:MULTISPECIES: hypothetical protein [unclassified Anaerococcus]MCW6679004.1 hypothetical protein [Anaerococcus sp. NML200574]
MNLLMRDFKYQLNKFKYCNFIIFIISLIIIVLSLSYKNQSIINYIFNFVLIDAGIISDFEDFFIPIFWIFMHILSPFILIIIFNKDHFVNGEQVMIKAKTKRKYFFSKCIASSINIIIFIGIFLFSIFIAQLIFYEFDHSTKYFLIIGFTMLIENILLTWMGIIIILYSNTYIAILCILVNLILSILTNIHLFIGQQSLVYKQNEFGGIFTFKENFLLLFLYTIIFIIVAYIFFARYDFYGVEK